MKTDINMEILIDRLAHLSITKATGIPEKNAYNEEGARIVRDVSFQVYLVTL